MAKFKKQSDEQVLMKGPVSWHQGEAGIGNLFKGKFKITACELFLTSRRLAACTKYQTFPFGPLIWLIRWMMGRKIIFEIPLSNVVSVDGGTQKGMQFTLKVSDGSEYHLISGGFTSKKKQQWVQAVSDAVVAACPGRAARVNEALVEFK